MTDKSGLGRLSPAHKMNGRHECYVPSAIERGALQSLASKVSVLTGSAVVEPAARVAMISEGPPGWASKGQRGGRRIEVILHDDTAAPRFGNAVDGLNPPQSPALVAGETLVFGRGLVRHEPAGDWRRTLTFEIDA